MGRNGPDHTPNQARRDKKAKNKMYYQKQSRWRGGSGRGGHGGGRGRGGWYNNNRIGPDGRSNQYSGQRWNDLAPGMKGFLCTTNFRESFCIREAYNILNEYAPPELDVKKEPIATDGVQIKFENQESKGESISVHPCSVSTAIKTSHHELPNDGGGDDGRSIATAPCPENEPMVIEVKVEDGSGDAVKRTDEKMDEDDDDDVDAAIKKEVQELKSERVRHRFKSANTGVTNVCFISTTIDDPLGLTEKIYEDVLNTKISKSRNILRFIPIEMTCLPNWEDIIDTLKIMLPKYLGEGIKSFKIEYSCRCNSKFNRADVMQLVGDLVSTINPMTFVDLDSPVYTIVVEVINAVVCLGVLTNYVRYRKYNLAEAAIPHEQTEPKKKNNKNKNKRKGRGGNSETAAAEMDTSVGSSQDEKAIESVRPTENSETVGPTENSEAVGPKENSETIGPTENSETVGATENSETVGATENSKTVEATENSKTVGPTENATVGPTKNSKAAMSLQVSETMTPSGISIIVTPTEPVSSEMDICAETDQVDSNTGASENVQEVVEMKETATGDSETGTPTERAETGSSSSVCKTSTPAMAVDESTTNEDISADEKPLATFWWSMPSSPSDPDLSIDKKK